MKVATLNCNGFRACVRKGFREWLNSAELDVLCLQEVRFAQEGLTGVHAPGDDWHWVQVDAEKKGYSSVAIWSRVEPVAVHRSIGLDWADREGRAVGMEFKNAVIWSIYFPSGTSGDERQAMKDDFLAFMTPKMHAWMALDKAVLMCGDVNIAHTELDIFHHKANAKKSGFLPRERQWMTDRLAEGWRDTLRDVRAGEEIYSWWSNRSKTAREKNVGWRIDYQLATTSWGETQSARVDKDPQISDHAPLVVDYEMTLEGA